MISRSRRVALAASLGLAIGMAAAVPSIVRADESGDLQAIVDRLANEATQREQMPNLLVAVSRRGERRYFTYGAAGPGGIAKDTVVEIGSITKVFTAALYAEAVRDGVMTPEGSLDQALATGLPLDRCTSAITMEDLASFRSGMPLLPSDVPRRLALRSERNYTVGDFYGWLSSWSPPTATPSRSGASPRERCGLPAPYEYSNAAVGLLGLLVAKAYDQSWDALIATRITGPIGAMDTAVWPDFAQDVRLAQGHGIEGNPVIAWPRFAWFAAGALRSTGQDMLAFGEAALGHRVVNGATVPVALTQAFAYSMHPLYQPEGKPFVQATAVWGLAPIDPDRPDGPRVAYKDGGTDGFNSVLVIDVRDDLAVFVVADRAKSGIPALGLEIVRRWAARSAR